MAAVVKFAQRQPDESPWLVWLRQHLRDHFLADADDREYLILNTINR